MCAGLGSKGTREEASVVDCVSKWAGELGDNSIHGGADELRGWNRQACARRLVVFYMRLSHILKQRTGDGAPAGALGRGRPLAGGRRRRGQAAWCCCATRARRGLLEPWHKRYLGRCGLRTRFGVGRRGATQLAHARDALERGIMAWFA
jgi:hypothetical protein